MGIIGSLVTGPQVLNPSLPGHESPAWLARWGRGSRVKAVELVGQTHIGVPPSAAEGNLVQIARRQERELQLSQSAWVSAPDPCGVVSQVMLQFLLIVVVRLPIQVLWVRPHDRQELINDVSKPRIHNASIASVWR